ncbi:sugar phosphate isomerase/epimerase family protein [Subtercola sp. YIM 133946]|uniref:sugar phosphate isomerase/epimerase family protein n=1 Tax=Subtercola sp. YIM 133946 TaxID=3118909 RepID=UPI002F94E9DB
MTDAARDELLATCWTHAGYAGPGWADETSPRSMIDRVEAIAQTGWSGIGIVVADLVAVRQTMGFAELRRLIESNGLAYTEIEILGDWWATGEPRRVSDGYRELFVEAAAELGARHLKVGGSMTDEPEHQLLVDEFGALCDDFAAVGTKVALEPFPFSNFTTVPIGARFIDEVNNANGGLCVDAWHIFRTETTLDEVAAVLRPEIVFAVELDDARGPIVPRSELFADTIDNRLLPGEGEWDLPAFVRVMRQVGFTGPWGVEIISHEHRARELVDGLEVARDAAYRVLEAGR